MSQSPKAIMLSGTSKTSVKIKKKKRNVGHNIAIGGFEKAQTYSWGFQRVHILRAAYVCRRVSRLRVSGWPQGVVKQKVKSNCNLPQPCVPSTHIDPLGKGGRQKFKVFKENWPTIGWPQSYADSGVRPRKPGLKIKARVKKTHKKTHKQNWTENLLATPCREDKL